MFLSFCGLLNMFVPVNAIAGSVCESYSQADFPPAGSKNWSAQRRPSAARWARLAGADVMRTSGRQPDFFWVCLVGDLLFSQWNIQHWKNMNNQDIYIYI